MFGLQFMIEPSNPVLIKMLDRLFASVANGPSMNCRPHNSRQRIDLVQLNRLKDLEPGRSILSLIGEDGSTKLVARVPAQAKAKRVALESENEPEVNLSPEAKALSQAWSDQQSLIAKLKSMADETRTYAQDTGVHALNIGFPLLSLPPGTLTGMTGVASRRILAPVAFVPMSLTVKAGTKQTVELKCEGEGSQRIVPNLALFAWLEQQFGQPLAERTETEEGQSAWEQIADLVKTVASRLDIKAPEIFSVSAMPENLELLSTPKPDQDEQGAGIIMSAVMGLFPSSNQGLLNDMRVMVAEGSNHAPLASFVLHGISLDASAVTVPGIEAANPPVVPRSFAVERLITLADPCQTRAVRLARQCSGLVIHGPPGTGKSQTIANVIGDHLAHGERVLFVCDKRTALDVVADRLNSLGVGDLCATVHDPQRDQRDLYRLVREQLDQLADTAIKPTAEQKLNDIDAELQRLHDQLSRYHHDLMGKQGGPGSFHYLMGQWLKGESDPRVAIDIKAIQKLTVESFEKHKDTLKEVLERGISIGYVSNPWRPAIGIDLAKFLIEPMIVYENSVKACLKAAEAADVTADPVHPPFEAGTDITAEARRRRELAERLGPYFDLPSDWSRYWASQSSKAVQTALLELASARPWIDALSTPLDDKFELAESTNFEAERLASEHKVLIDYVNAFRKQLAFYETLRAAAPDAPDATVLKWMAADPKIIASARKRLAGAAPLADAVAADSLDLSMLARWQARPLETAKLMESLAALNAYLDVSSSWKLMFQGATKKAAAAVVAEFGLSLTPESSVQVKSFLIAMQRRIDLRAAFEAATGPFDGQIDGDDLLHTFTQHRLVLSAIPEKGVAASTLEDLGQPQTNAPSINVTALLNNQIQALADVARPILTQYSLDVNGTNAKVVADFLAGLEARIRLRGLLARFSHRSAIDLDTNDPNLLSLSEQNRRLFELLLEFPPGTVLGDTVRNILMNPANATAAVAALSRSPERAAAIVDVDKTMSDANLFSKPFLKAVHDALLANKHLAKPISNLQHRLKTLQDLIRVKEGLARLPAELATAATACFGSALPASTGYSSIRRQVLAGEIQRRLASVPNLQAQDGHRLQAAFYRYRELSDAKKGAVRDVIQNRWVARQKDRLLSKTGTRLNRMATDLRMRLTTRGDRATRLRQVIAHGAGIEEGDPLFDLRPVWMASPETVAQLFPREPIFDVVIFDEASQCRLEEALPVITRAKRVVIAGDPKQLPPTRFFESAVIKSEDVEAETDQEFFEAQQGDVEDLLTAALGLEVQQSYLDVHYRSKNADLIEFSNRHFYSSRLQAVPTHPNRRNRNAPITFHRSEGVYEKRRNPAEAKIVCDIVRDLLNRPTPPSIGIACFNLVQRDLIVDTLEELAEADTDFARRLSEARERRSASSSEGLFVKNLENVQGDERDHLIISTTYGPDASGKFRRSFGPLGSAGGGRRLNVLITRAREELHIVTSIPRSAYISLPEVPAGKTAGGAWLLFAYLAYAEQLQLDYEQNQRILASSAGVARASVYSRPTLTPSAFSAALAASIATNHGYGSDVHWGNEGFGIDLAILHPKKPEDVTIGVLCDMTRFSGTDDPVEWDVFRTGVHESQGWKLHRLWTPHFFRDASGSIAEIATLAGNCVSEESALTKDNALSAAEDPVVD